MRSLVLAVTAVAAIAAAYELPALPPAAAGNPSARTFHLDQHQVRPAGPSQCELFWVQLERMLPAERANARIEILAEPPGQQLARQAEALWNDGRFNEALELMHQLCTVVDPRAVEVGVAWRVPVPTLQTDWGSDVRIGNRDSVELVAFDIDRSNGHLFVVLLMHGGTGYRWTVNISTDDGANWAETYSWNAAYQMMSLSATVLGDFLYITFGRGPAQNQAFLYRCRTSDGQQQSFRTGTSYINIDSTAAGDSITEVSIVSNQDQYDNRMYYGQLRTSDSLKYFWSSDTGGVTWTEVATPIRDAQRGLDMTCNQGFDSSFLYLSYYDAHDTLKIYSRASGWHREYERYTGSGGRTTSICAYQDTVLCAFEYYGSRYWNMYLTRYDGNPTWYYGWFDDTTTTQEAPAVTGRLGGGQAAVYRFYAMPRELRFVWRNYRGSWSTPVVVGDLEPYWNTPGIEYLGRGNYGVVFLSRSNPVRACYFDRSDWTGVAEQRRLVMEENILSVAPNPLTGRGMLNYNLNRPANLVVRVYARDGRAVRTLFEGRSEAGRRGLAFDATTLPPGVYFARADADGQVLTVPFTVAR